VRLGEQEVVAERVRLEQPHLGLNRV
jgi:hypothetical protein